MNALLPQEQTTDRIAQRTEALFAVRQDTTYRRTDRMFAGLMAAQYVACIAVALWLSPLAWAGASSTVHPHVWAAALLGGVISAFPILLVWTHSGSALTRQSIAIGQMLTSALLIHLTGGRIETHFHIFGSLAFLAYYRDWRVLATASAVVALDHILRGYFWPQSIFGVLAAPVWRAVEHIGWVIFEDVFLIIAGREMLNRVRENCVREAQLEATNERIERRTAELRASEESLAVTLHSIGDAVLATDTKGCVTRMNLVAEKLTGWTQAEAQGRPVAEVFRIFNEQTRQPAVIPVDTVLATGKIHALANGTIIIARDGTECPIADSAAPISDKAGRVIGVVLVFRDVTEEHKAAKIRSQFAAIVSSSQDAIISQSVDDIITSWNPGAERLFGYLTEEVVGQPVAMLFPQDKTKEDEEVRRRLQTGESVPHFESICLRKGGERIDVSVSISPLRDGTGRLVAVSTIARDITEKKTAEAQLHAMVEELGRSNQELQQFAYVASHDLKEPLRAVTGCVQLLQSQFGSVLGGRGQEFISHAVDGAKRMQQLIDGLLSYSRLDQQDTELQPTDFNVILQQARENLEAALEESGAKILIADRLPTMNCYPGLIAQVFQNLLSNAIKFRGEKPAEIRISAEERGTEYLFTVRDNGIGFEPEFSERVFALFQRLHTRRKYAGTGIGLATCKRAIERHHGRIWVEAQLGQGATFHFTLPKQTS